ncbi:Uncharacterised protein [Escherichia coli]|nr:hypothetical protein HmCmsJML108_01771 [Escherichia coli]CUK15136.1 Uncharacterised protein [Escherichia coli]
MKPFSGFFFIKIQQRCIKLILQSTPFVLSIGTGNFVYLCKSIAFHMGMNCNNDRIPFCIGRLN